MKLNEAIEKLNSTLNNFEAKTRQIKQERENLAADLQEKIEALNQATKTITELKKMIPGVEVKNKNMELQPKKKENAGSANQLTKMKSIINSLEADRNKLQEKVAQLQLNLQAQPEKRKLVKKKFKCSECGGIIYESDAVCSHCDAKFE